jgi:hypothetical protein
VPRDVCEIKYPVDIPLIGVEEVGVPVYRLVHDAMQAGMRFLPQYLPQAWNEVQPYINELKADVIADVEYEADYLADKLLDTHVMPRVENLKEETFASVRHWRDEILLTLMAVGAASVVAVGVGAWWVNQRELQRDRGGR